MGETKDIRLKPRIGKGVLQTAKFQEESCPDPRRLYHEEMKGKFAL